MDCPTGASRPRRPWGAGSRFLLCDILPFCGHLSLKIGLRRRTAAQRLPTGSIDSPVVLGRVDGPVLVRGRSRLDASGSAATSDFARFDASFCQALPSKGSIRRAPRAQESFTLMSHVTPATVVPCRLRCLDVSGSSATSDLGRLDRLGTLTFVRVSRQGYQPFGPIVLRPRLS